MTLRLLKDAMMKKLYSMAGRPLLYKLATGKVKECPFDIKVILEMRQEMKVILQRSTT